MKEILERHHLHSKNLARMEQPSLELQVGFGSGCGGERDSEVSLETVNSSTLESSMSCESICSTSFSRLSFNLLPPSPESLSIKPRCSSDFAYSAIRSATFLRKAALSFRDIHLLRRISAGDIGTVYLCHLRHANNNQFNNHEEDASCLYAMKTKTQWH
ncbi:hypothetical protein JHK85_025679 [Glycine max]|nr:hypothetical protein JHK85_025679 [Glycine max]KAG5012920.1 hypothetical protein JHK86_025181 [Glycine max]